MDFGSWGRYPAVRHSAYELELPITSDEFAGPETVLPFGLGRSYGDSCLNEGNKVLVTRRLDHLVSFNSGDGLLVCEAGVSLDEILQFAVPRGWFLPVTPGTRFVTVGGAIANDVHGKNHHVAGTFGKHVEWFELHRSDRGPMRVSANENAEWYRATIGGLGLTGLITQAAIRLKRITNSFIKMQSIKFGSLDEFGEISASSDKDYEYTVAWLDCTAKGSAFGRGLFMRGNHSDDPGLGLRLPSERPKISVPIDCPNFLLNSLTARAFNSLYYHKQLAKHVEKNQFYEPFFYPLDSVANWNRVYGRRGFFQFQCVVPDDRLKTAKELLRIIVDSGAGSPLAVLKHFGSVASPGLMSFPIAGVTIALDFAFQGPKTLELMARLDKAVLAAGGRIYPAKDATMAAESFTNYYPQWQEFAAHVDPRFSSSFWRRVTG